MTDSVAVHVELLNEDVDVWRPVAAVREREDAYRLDDSKPEDEEWAFPPGSLVRCEIRILEQGSEPDPCLVATALAE
jgi:hypothetical protein